MRCPLAKSNAAAMIVAYGDGTTYRIDREKERELFQCDEGNCGWWDGDGNQCALLSLVDLLDELNTGDSRCP